MKIERSQGGQLPGLGSGSLMGATGQSFSAVLASGRSLAAITEDRALGFSETGIFGAYGRRDKADAAPSQLRAKVSVSDMGEPMIRAEAQRIEIPSSAFEQDEGQRIDIVRDKNINAESFILNIEEKGGCVFAEANQNGGGIGYRSADVVPRERNMARVAVRQCRRDADENQVVISLFGDDRNISIKVNGDFIREDEEKIRDRLKITALYFGMNLRDIMLNEKRVDMKI